MSAQINLKPALATAKQSFAGLSPTAMADKALVEFNATESYFLVPFLGQMYQVYYPHGLVMPYQQQGDVPEAVQIVLLHYLAKCSTRMPEGAKIAFSELPSGSIYILPFHNRSIKPLTAIFGHQPEKIITAGLKIGGWQETMGDAAVTVPVLPKIPITFVLWGGDEEFAPSGNILFDVSASSHLHTEDYALLPGLAIFEMKKLISASTTTTA